MIYWKHRNQCRPTISGAAVFDLDDNKVARVHNKKKLLEFLRSHLGKQFFLYLEEFRDFPPPDTNTTPGADALFLGTVCLEESGKFRNDADKEECFYRKRPTSAPEP
jgi:hypothetical protein